MILVTLNEASNKLLIYTLLIDIISPVLLLVNNISLPSVLPINVEFSILTYPSSAEIITPVLVTLLFVKLPVIILSPS